MKTDYLLPYPFKKIGWYLFVSFALLFFTSYFDLIPKWNDELLSFPTLVIARNSLFAKTQILSIEKTGMLDELLLCLTLIGAYMLCFSREKIEDEFTQYLRMKSLIWAVKLNTILLILGTWFCFGTVYITIVLLSMLSIFLFFECRFRYELYNMRKGNEE